VTYAYLQGFPRSSGLGAVTDGAMIQSAGKSLGFMEASVITGYEGTPQTVAAMIEAAKGPRGERNVSVRRSAEAVVRGLQQKDYTSEIAALYYWVCGSTRYTHDPKHVEYVKDPLATLDEIRKNGRATVDCDDLATVLAALLLSVGVRMWFATVDFKPCDGHDNYSHVFAVAQDPKSGTRVVVDPVAGPRTKEMLNRVRCSKFYEVD
jgi:transglutaminase superfamily protein